MTQPRLSLSGGEHFERLVQAYIHDARYTTTAQATCNVIYSVVNAGMVMLPYAAGASGVGLFVVCVVFSCLLSGYTSVMLVKMAHDRAVHSCEELGELAFGPKGYYILAVMQMCFSSLIIIMLVHLFDIFVARSCVNHCVCVCRTLNVFGDIIRDFIESMGRDQMNGWLHYLTKRTTTIIIGAALVLPRCFSASMSRLWMNSLVTLCALSVVMVAIVFVFLSAHEAEQDTDRSHVNPFRVTPQWWLTPGITLFAVSHQQVPPNACILFTHSPSVHTVSSHLAYL